MASPISAVPLLVGALLWLDQPQVPVFRADTNLQSIAVQVTDRRGKGVRGLTAQDFTVLEDGRPQKIAFFGAEDQPISLAILLDSSGSMESGRKLERAQSLLGPLVRGTQREDEIFLVPFTHRIGPFVPLTPKQRLNPPLVHSSSTHGGTALYDALATALCHLRTARNVKQAVVVITDGSDQNSRLRIDRLIHLTRSSQAQIFMIGFWSQDESNYYRQAESKLTLVSGHEIDNPLEVFDRIAKESGAESFFPSSERDLKQVLDRIMGILRAEYTLAYYPRNIEKFRRIQVEVRRRGIRVSARHTAGSDASGADIVHFRPNSCQVSPVDDPYPWEPLVTQNPSGTITYRETFSDERTGWPNRPGSRYVSGAYEMSRTVRAKEYGQGIGEVPGTIAAYGPWWDNFVGSISVDDRGSDQDGEDMVFRLNDEGYYALLVTRIGTRHSSFKFVRTRWAPSFLDPLRSRRETIIIPWTEVAELYSGVRQREPGKATQEEIKVQCRGPQIKIWLDGKEAGQIRDDTFQDGYIGMAQFGYGRVLFRDLRVQSLQT